MTALRVEIEGAMQEGVEMMTLQSPVEIEVNEEGHCTALITQLEKAREGILGLTGTRIHS